jgi:ribosomal protein S27E
MGFMKEFKKALNDEQTLFEVNGIRVTCSHCGATSFTRGEAQLNTAGLSFLGLDWANRSATVLICDSCGKIEWFLENPEEA